MTPEAEVITVLNVDDYQPARYQRSRVLRSAGFVVVEASSGREALDLTRTARPHIIVLDVNLPDMSGFDVCRQIKADPVLESTLVLHLSASSVNPASKVAGLAGGADSYLAEPIDPDELVANVHALLRIKRAEAQLRQANLTLEAIVGASPHGIVAMATDGRVRRWNLAAERMFGWPERALLGRPLPIMPAHEQAAFEQCLRRAAGGELPGPYEATAIRRDGSSLDVNVSLAPLRDAHQQVDGVLALVEDITARKRIERDVARLYQEAQQANRTKDEFLATLSHELRTPLNAVLGWVRLLRTGELPEGSERRALEVIERNAIAQVRLIEDILDVSRIVSGKLRLRSEPVQLGEIIEAAADVIRPSAERAHVRLDVSVEDSAPESLTTLGDPQRLQQVVVNLVSNAVKFTPAGGHVRLLLRPVQEWLEITVHDTGIGIDPALLPFVFERFRQGDSSTARAHGGLGLGLAIVRHIVEAHGGNVTARSDGPGRGSTFVVVLPAAPVRAAAAAADDEPSPSASLESLRVLIVEDDADSRGLMEALLSGRGAVVQATEGTDRALQLLAREPFDVVVADIGLPHVDGFALLHRMRGSQFAHIPAVAVTGFASEEDRLRATAAGYVAHVAKPFDAEVLVRAIAKAAQRA